jgi:hypothetical protein
MMGRRTATMLCVLLAHAYVIYYSMVDLWTPFAAVPPADPSEVMEVEIVESDRDDDEPPPPSFEPWKDPPLPQAPVEESVAEAAGPPAGESQAPEFVDWPIEQRISAKRAIEAEIESERLAKKFAGPDGTWASLTKRQRSKLSKFRWRPGVDGFTYDDKGQAIYTLPNGCTIVNLAFIGCPLGKAKVHGDMFENMREYFDEQRLPRTDEGNGTEPEALRPAN